jgi:tetratricopeptide (TPR) repeat protein
VVTEGWRKPLEDALSGDRVGCAVSSSNAGLDGQRVKPGYKLPDVELAEFALRRRIEQRGRIEDIAMGLPVALAVRREDLLLAGLPGEFQTEAMLMELERRLAESGMRVVCAQDSYVHRDGAEPPAARREREAVIAVERARSLAEKTAFEAALKLLDQAIALKSDYAEALYERGVLRSVSGAAGLAELDFKEYVRLRPDDSKGHNNLGCVLFGLGRVGEAEAALTRAIEAWPANWEAKKNLADLRLAEGKAREAMELYLKMVEEHSDRPEVYVAVSEIFAATGDLDAAEQFARLAKRLEPDNAGAERVLQSIDISRARVAAGGGSLESRI